MKKLFLTSGIIACMACPAFADPATGFPGAGDPIVVPSGSQANSCVEGVLGATSGDVQLEAQWDPIWHSITLDVNSANGGLTNGTPTPMYSVEGDAHVYKTRTGTSNDDFAFGTPIAAEATLLSTPAVGAYVNHTLNDNLPGGWTTSDLTTQSSSVQEHRAFNGYYSAPTSGTQYTNGSTLTSQGASAASSASADQTWYAQYGCGEPELTNPALPGYSFDGWSLNTANPNAILDADNGDFCITANDTLVANWTAQTQHIAYSCGTAPAGATTTVTGQAPAQQNVATDATYTLATLGNGECSLPGYTFAGWDCPNLPNGTANASGYYNEGTTGSFHYVGTVTCTAKWTQGTINLHWDAAHADTVTSAGGSTCTYDGAVVVPAASRTGYTLTGWDVVTPTPATPDNTANSTY